MGLNFSSLAGAIRNCLPTGWSVEDLSAEVAATIEPKPAWNKLFVAPNGSKLFYHQADLDTLSNPILYIYQSPPGLPFGLTACCERFTNQNEYVVDAPCLASYLRSVYTKHVEPASGSMCVFDNARRAANRGTLVTAHADWYQPIRNEQVWMNVTVRFNGQPQGEPIKVKRYASGADVRRAVVAKYPIAKDATIVLSGSGEALEDSQPFSCQDHRGAVNVIASQESQTILAVKLPNGSVVNVSITPNTTPKAILEKLPQDVVGPAATAAGRTAVLYVGNTQQRVTEVAAQLPQLRAGGATVALVSTIELTVRTAGSTDTFSTITVAADTTVSNLAQQLTAGHPGHMAYSNNVSLAPGDTRTLQQAGIRTGQQVAVTKETFQSRATRPSAAASLRHSK